MEERKREAMVAGRRERLWKWKEKVCKIAWRVGD